MTDFKSISPKQLAIEFGGKFHGPNVEHLSIPETKYFEMFKYLCDLVTAERNDLLALLILKDEALQTCVFQSPDYSNGSGREYQFDEAKISRAVALQPKGARLVPASYDDRMCGSDDLFRIEVNQ